MAWMLKANRDLLPPFYLVHLYEEVVKVHRGVAICFKETSRDAMLRSGAYSLVGACDDSGNLVPPEPVPVPPVEDPPIDEKSPPPGRKRSRW